MPIAESHPAAPGAPLVSIGIPVYNSELTLAKTLDCLLAQTFEDFEVIISDNGSKDGTAEICQAYARIDSRIRYVRQSVNLGATRNFKFVLAQARGKYFHWLAGDDTRSDDFLAENVSFLESHPDYVASTSPNSFEGMPAEGAGLVSFAIAAPTAHERFHQFFEHCWKSHAIFYSVIRRETLVQCDYVGQSFFAADWAIDLFLVSRGKVHRTQRGRVVFGLNGISSKASSYKVFRNRAIELLLPFWHLSRLANDMSAGFPLKERCKLWLALTRLNLWAGKDQAHSALYQFYNRHFKNKKHAAGSTQS